MRWSLIIKMLLNHLSPSGYNRAPCFTVPPKWHLTREKQRVRMKSMWRMKSAERNYVESAKLPITVSFLLVCVASTMLWLWYKSIPWEEKKKKDLAICPLLLHRYLHFFFFFPFKSKLSPCKTNCWNRKHMRPTQRDLLLLLFFFFFNVRWQNMIVRL